MRFWYFFFLFPFAGDNWQLEIVLLCYLWVDFPQSPVTCWSDNLILLLSSFWQCWWLAWLKDDTASKIIWSWGKLLYMWFELVLGWPGFVLVDSSFCMAFGGFLTVILVLHQNRPALILNFSSVWQLMPRVQWFNKKWNNNVYILDCHNLWWRMESQHLH